MFSTLLVIYNRGGVYPDCQSLRSENLVCTFGSALSCLPLHKLLIFLKPQIPKYDNMHAKLSYGLAYVGTWWMLDVVLFSLQRRQWTWAKYIHKYSGTHNTTVHEVVGALLVNETANLPGILNIFLAIHSDVFALCFENRILH